MPTKRETLMDDVDRMADNLFNNYPHIRDQESFNISYDLYFEQEKHIRNDKQVRKKMFDILRMDNPRISSGSLHKEAGGKSLSQDRLKTANTVVTNKKEYIRRGAQNVDLKDYDTVSKRDGVTVFARKVTVTKNGKTETHFEDKKGRKATPIRKQKQ